MQAEVMVNLCLNNEAIRNSDTGALRQWLIDQGADYARVANYGGNGETVVVVYNPRIIKSVEIVRGSEIKGDADLPGAFT
jgi:hypothetical protein